MTLACSATRVAVGVSVTCALLHGGLLVVGGGAMLAMTAPMLILALVCAACGRHLWHRASGPGFVVMGTAAAAMVSLHLILEHGHIASPETSDGDHFADVFGR